MKPASVSCTRDASAQCHGLPVLHWRGRRTTASGARTASGQGSRQRQQWQASGKCNGGLSSHWGGRRTIASTDEPTGTASGQGSRQRQQWQSSGKCNGGLSSHWGGRRTTASGEEKTRTASRPPKRHTEVQLLGECQEPGESFTLSDAEV